MPCERLQTRPTTQSHLVAASESDDTGLMTLLSRAVIVLRAEAQARQGLERLLAHACGLRAPSLHLPGEPLDLGGDRALVPGGGEALRVTASGPPSAIAGARRAVDALYALAPLLQDAERRADTRVVLGLGETMQGGLVGRSWAMRQLHDRIGKVASKDFVVLIEGESGSGKELVARRVHALSARSSGPFIALNCAAIVETLFEAELFGIEERTATGVRGRRGRFEQADGGTLFLDEIADLSAAAQAKLLRIIQDPTVERVGGYGSRRVDVRIIAATNRSLESLCKRGEFRWDLFYRLNAVEVAVPPLRARRDDIPYLVEAILQRVAEGQNYRVAPDALDALGTYEWPGNVRELERVIERAVTLARTQTIHLDDLPDIVTGRYREACIPEDGIDLTLRAWGSRYARRVLQRTNGNKREACRILGISYHTLQAYLGFDTQSRARLDEPRAASQREAMEEEIRGGSTTYPHARPDVSMMVHEPVAPRLDTSSTTALE